MTRLRLCLLLLQVLLSQAENAQPRSRYSIERIPIVPKPPQPSDKQHGSRSNADFVEEPSHPVNVLAAGRNRDVRTAWPGDSFNKPDPARAEFPPRGHLQSFAGPGGEFLDPADVPFRPLGRIPTEGRVGDFPIPAALLQPRDQGQGQGFNGEFGDPARASYQPLDPRGFRDTNNGGFQDPAKAVYQPHDARGFQDSDFAFRPDGRTGDRMAGPPMDVQTPTVADFNRQVPTQVGFNVDSPDPAETRFPDGRAAFPVEDPFRTVNRPLPPQNGGFNDGFQGPADPFNPPRPFGGGGFQVPANVPQGPPPGSNDGFRLPADGGSPDPAGGVGDDDLFWRFPVEGDHAFFPNGDAVPRAPAPNLTVIDKLFSQVADLQQDLDVLDEDLSAAMSRLAALSGYVDQLENQAAKLSAIGEIVRDEKNALIGEVSRLESELDRAEAHLNETEASLQVQAIIINSTLQTEALIRAKEPHLYGRLHGLQTSLKNKKVTLLHELECEEKYFDSAFNLQKTLLHGLQEKTFSRKCEAGTVTLHRGELRGEYFFETDFGHDIPQIHYGISGYLFSIQDLEENSNSSSGSSLGVSVFARPSTRGVIVQANSLAFNRASLVSVSVAFDACSIGAVIS